MNRNSEYNFAQFLSTPSARRATHAVGAVRRAKSNFYPRPPRGGRPEDFRLHYICTMDFYPRPPRGGRPGQHSGVECNHHISIHALREEGDRSWTVTALS